jgi:hypothetical protein
MLHESEQSDRRSRRVGDFIYKREQVKPRYGMHQDHVIYQGSGRSAQEFGVDILRDHYNTDLSSRQNINVLPVIEKNKICYTDAFSGNDGIKNARIGESSGIYRYKSIYDTVYPLQNRGDRKEKCNTPKMSQNTDIKLLTSYEAKSNGDSYTERHVGAVKCNMIEVAPGQYMRLRGADETWTAIQDDFYAPCVCYACDLTLFCIQNATYVLCPQCQVVNPFDGDESKGGVGLGFTIESLSKWQNEILMRRQINAVECAR